jgi:hypothetical protein
MQLLIYSEVVIDMKRTLLTMSVVFLLGSCVSEKPIQVVTQKPTQFQIRKEHVRSTVGGVPKWYQTPPKEGETYFASATSTSDDMQLAVDKAVLSAKRILADRLDGLLSSTTKTVTTESKGKTSSSLSRTTTNEIRNGDSSGYSVKEVVVQPSEDLYRAYVLVEYVPW